MKLKSLHSLVAACCLLVFSAVITRAADLASYIPESDSVSLEADTLSHSMENNTAEATGNVILKYGVLEIHSDKAIYDNDTGDFSVEGNVTAILGNRGTWKTDALKGNIKAEQFSFGPFRLEAAPWYAAGEAGIGQNKQNETDAQQGESAKKDEGAINLSRSWLSTCELENPHYRLQAKKIIYNADGTFKATNMLLYIRNVPVFYLPIFYGTTKDTAGFVFKPGYSGKRGAYLRIQRYWNLAWGLKDSVYLDLMTKRGIGIGADGELSTPARELSYTLYGINDAKKPETSHGWNGRFKSERNRYRVAAYLREQITDDLTLRLNADWASDIDMLKDWFRSDYRRANQPRSFLNLSYDADWFNTSLQVRPRINNYYTVVESLPEFKFDIPRLAIFDTGIFYSSHSTAGYYRTKWRDYDKDRKTFLDSLTSSWFDPDVFDDPADYSAGRLDTLHILTRPFDIGDAFTLTPRAAGRITYYTRSSRQKVNKRDLADMAEADDPDQQHNTYFPEHIYDKKGGERTRFAAELGLEGKSRFFSDWSDYENDTLSIKGLRHVLTPYFDYTFAPEPTENCDHLYFFDEIDRLERQNFLRLGINQDIQTKRHNTLATLLSLNTYYDQHFIHGGEDDNLPGDFGAKISFYPTEKLTLWSMAEHDCGTGTLHRGEAGTRYTTDTGFAFSTSYAYMNDYMSRGVYSMASTLQDFSGDYGYTKRYYHYGNNINAAIDLPLNSITALHIEGSYDFTRGDFIEHFYTLSRKLHCWIASIGCGWDDDEFEVIFMMRLKAFPNIKIDLNI